MDPNYVESLFNDKLKWINVKNNPNIEDNLAYNFIIGHRDDYDILFIPIHLQKDNSWYKENHWIIGIYDKAGVGGKEFIYLFDPKPRKNENEKMIFDPNHREILTYIKKVYN